jgi:hypothetical protein
MPSSEASVSRSRSSRFEQLQTGNSIAAHVVRRSSGRDLLQSSSSGMGSTEASVGAEGWLENGT